MPAMTCQTVGQNGLEEARIDAQFAQMQEDERYRALQLQMAKEFEKSDWEALCVGEACGEITPFV
jgi:hypothetical protein